MVLSTWSSQPHWLAAGRTLLSEPVNENIISAIIPCYNEAKTIETVIAAVRTAPVASCEIIIVDDGSTDGTRELLRGPLQSQVDQVIFHHQNQGKGAALRTGFQARYAGAPPATRAGTPGSSAAGEWDERCGVLQQRYLAPGEIGCES